MIMEVCAKRLSQKEPISSQRELEGSAMFAVMFKLDGACLPWMKLREVTAPRREGCDLS